MIQLLIEIVFSTRLRMCEQGQDFVSVMPRTRGRCGLAGLGAEHDQAGSVMLANHQKGKNCSESSCVVELVRIVCPEVHRGARIQKDMAANVCVVLELFN